MIIWHDTLGGLIPLPPAVRDESGAVRTFDPNLDQVVEVENPMEQREAVIAELKRFRLMEVGSLAERLRALDVAIVLLENHAGYCWDD